MRITRIEDNITEIRLNNKRETFLIEQLNFFGVIPTRKSKIYTYFRCNGSMADAHKYLGI